jgi:signal transduction histidine kinase
MPVEITIAPGEPNQLVGDSRRIRQIPINYIGNALKYANRGRVKVSVQHTITNPGYAEIDFAASDEGPEISMAEQSKLFTGVERCTNTRHSQIPGTGLGLALGKTLAEQMGGRVWLASEAVFGSCFNFSATFALFDQTTKSAPPPAESPTIKSTCAFVVHDKE